MSQDVFDRLKNTKSTAKTTSVFDRLKNIDTSAGDKAIAGKRVDAERLKVTSNLENQKRQAMMDQDTTALNQIEQRLKSIRAVDGKQTLGDRASDALSTIMNSSASAYTNLAGLGADLVRGGVEDHNSRQIARMQAQLASGKSSTGSALSDSDRKILQDAIARMNGETEQWAGRTNSLQQSADTMQATGAQFEQSAKAGLGKVGQTVVDVGIAGGQMAGDALINAMIPGSGLVAMGLRSAGGAAQTARQEGATTEQQAAYGLGSGILSVATEKIANVAGPFKKGFGSGVLDSAINKAVGKLGSSAVGKIALSFLSEGGEEVLEDVLQPILQRATYDPEALAQYQDPEFLANTLHDGLVGGILGGIGGAADVAGSRLNRNAAPSPTVESTQANAEGSFTPTARRAAEGVSGANNAAPGVGTALNENGLGALTERERINLSSGKKNRVISTFQDAVSFIQNALSNKSNVDRAYMGKVPDAVAQKVFTETGIDISGYNAVIPGDSVRHMFKHHGDPLVEDARNQVALTPEAAARIPEIIANPDVVTRSQKADAAGRPALFFEKAMGDQYITVQAVSDGTHSIQADTLYIRKRTPQDTVSNTDVATPALNSNVRNVPPQGSFSDSTISQGAENVKSGSGDVLLDILTGGKRVEQSTLTPEQFDAAAEQGYAMDADGKVYYPNASEHIDRRGLDTVADRKLNAFQFDHPEVHSYFQQAAESLMADAELSASFPPVQRKEATVHGRRYIQSIVETPSLRSAMDAGLSRPDIVKAAQALIDDHGQENYAAAKRLELVLDEMLTNGYTTTAGDTVGPNQDYLAAKSAIPGYQEQTVTDGTDELPIWDIDETTGRDTPGDAVAGFDPYSRLQNQNDTFHPEGANAVRPLDVPTENFDGSNIPRSASNIMGAQGIDETDVRFLERQIASGALHFDTITDAESVGRAQNAMAEKGFDGALEQYRQAVASGVASKDNTTLGQQLLLQSMREGNAANTAELLSLYTRNSTTVAQALQAQSIFRKLSPEGQLVAVQKAVDDFNAKHGTEVQIDQEAVQDFLNAADEDARGDARDRIFQSAADQVPGTFKEKFDAIRYLAMLGNPRTHVRNIVGNTLFQPVVAVKNRVGSLAELVANSISGGKVERTKSVTGVNPASALAAECRADWANVADKLSQSKYSQDQTSLWNIEEERKAFRDQGVGKAMNYLSDKNSYLLETEDAIAKKFIYSQSLAGYLKANGVNTLSEADTGLLDRARNYAAQEAMRNTFNDRNQVSDAVSKLGGATRSDNKAVRAAGYVVEGLLPFKRTPANILVRAVEYSPAGTVLGAIQTARGIKAGDSAQITAGLDRAAAGLTGSALMLAGMAAGAAGYITGGDDEDDKQQDFNDLLGHQNYALELADGTSITLDWLAPEAIPLFMGVQLAGAMADGGLSLEDIGNAAKSIADPMLEMSMLQGLNDTVNNASYAANNGGSVLGSILTSALTSYVTQVFPTLFGQVERIGTDRRETTYTDKNSAVPSDLQYLLGNIGNKVPGWDYNQIPYIDAWGREEETGDVMERTVNNLFNPAYVSQVDVDSVEQELQRLADTTGETGVFPVRAARYLTVDGERVDLTAEQYTQYAKTLGQSSYKTVSAGIQTAAYRKMSDTEKADYLSKLYAYAGQTAKASVTGYEMDTWVQNAKNARQDLGVSPEEYIALYQQYGSSILSGSGYEKTKQAVQAGLSVEEYANLRGGIDADGNGSVTQAEAQAYLDGQDFPTEQKADLWSIINKSWKKNPYA